MDLKPFYIEKISNGKHRIWLEGIKYELGNRSVVLQLLLYKTMMFCIVKLGKNIMKKRIKDIKHMI